MAIILANRALYKADLASSKADSALRSAARMADLNMSICSRKRLLLSDSNSDSFDGFIIDDSADLFIASKFSKPDLSIFNVLDKSVTIH